MPNENIMPNDYRDSQQPYSYVNNSVSNRSYWAGGEIITAQTMNNIEGMIDAITQGLPDFIISGNTDNDLSNAMLKPYNKVYIDTSQDVINIASGEQFDSIRDMIAPFYVSGNNYNQGDYVLYETTLNGNKIYKLYKAKYNVINAENLLNQQLWTQIKILGASTEQSKSIIQSIQDSIAVQQSAYLIPMYQANPSETKRQAYFVRDGWTVTITTPNGPVVSENPSERYTWYTLYYDNNKKSLPPNIFPGYTYKLKYSTTNAEAQAYIGYYNNQGSSFGVRYYTKDSIITIPENAVSMIMRIQILEGVQFDTPVTVSQFNLVNIRTVKTLGEQLDKNITIVDSLQKLKTLNFPVGKLVRTRGFFIPNDYGGGLYEIKQLGSEIINNRTVFQANNSNIIKRIFDQPFIYLESLDITNCTNYENINTIIEETGITDVRCYKIETQTSIKISNYNFTFDTIRYIKTGNNATGPVLVLQDLNQKVIKGRLLIGKAQDNVQCLRCQTSGAVTASGDKKHFNGNRIEIDRIETSGAGVVIRPANGCGILQNRFKFGTIQGVKISGGTGPTKGIDITISAKRDENDNLILDSEGLPSYSFQGEDHFDVSLISVSNNGLSAKAVYIKVEECVAADLGNLNEGNLGASIYGTITGIDFDHLSVQGSDNGIWIECGNTNPTLSYKSECGIKSIIVNNMRVRQALKNRFFYINGWVKDIYIHTTSKVLLGRIGSGEGLGFKYYSNTDSYTYPIVNPSPDAVVIDNACYASKQIGSYYYDFGMGEKLCCKENICYFEKQTPETLQIHLNKQTRYQAQPELEGNQYIVRNFSGNGYPCVSKFKIGDEFSNSIVKLDLREYYSIYNITGVNVYIPENCICKVKVGNMDQYTTINQKYEKGINYILKGNINNRKDGKIEIIGIQKELIQNIKNINYTNNVMFDITENNFETFEYGSIGGDGTDLNYNQGSSQRIRTDFFKVDTDCCKIKFDNSLEVRAAVYSESKIESFVKWINVWDEEEINILGGQYIRLLIRYKNDTRHYMNDDDMSFISNNVSILKYNAKYKNYIETVEAYNKPLTTKWKIGTLSLVTGQNLESNTRIRMSVFVQIPDDDKQYKVKINSNDLLIRVGVYNEANNNSFSHFAGIWAKESQVIPNGKYIRVIAKFKNNDVIQSDMIKGITKLINFSVSWDKYEKRYNLLAGKTVAILGDSISTTGTIYYGEESQVPEIIIQEEDVNEELKVLLTYRDFHPYYGNGKAPEDTTTQNPCDGVTPHDLILGNITYHYEYTSKSNGGDGVPYVTYTINGTAHRDILGTQQYTFIPTVEDVGKHFGQADNHNYSWELPNWWQIAQRELGFIPLNACFSGSCITRARHLGDDVGDRAQYHGVHAWNINQIRRCGRRIPGTMIRESPDVIIIYRGTNDYGSPQRGKHPRVNTDILDVGIDFNFDTYFHNYKDVVGIVRANGQVVSKDAEPQSGDKNVYGFTEAYLLTVLRLQQAYPFAKIFLCTLTDIKRTTTRNNLYPMGNDAGTLQQWNQAIRKVAEYTGCGLIDLAKCGINYFNCMTYMPEDPATGVHPYRDGQYAMGRRAIADLKAQYGPILNDWNNIKELLEDDSIVPCSDDTGFPSESSQGGAWQYVRGKIKAHCTWDGETVFGE